MMKKQKQIGDAFTFRSRNCGNYFMKWRKQRNVLVI